MRKISIILASLACIYACEKPLSGPAAPESVMGELNVSIERSDIDTKASYTTVLDEEKVEKRVSVLVFNKSNKRLDAYKEISSSSANCTMSIPTGEKVIYVVINGPSLSSITSESELNAIVDDFSSTSIAANGLTMMGKNEATVSVGTSATVPVIVNRLASRIVLQGITNNIPAQYGKIRLESVFLANAYSKCTIGGVSSDMVNMDGFEDGIAKTKPIGKNGNTGLCPSYLYKSIGSDLLVGSNNSAPYILYAHPNSSATYTKLMLYVTYGGNLSGYYPVELNKKLKANTTYTISLTLKNVPVPDPDDNFEVGSSSITITVKDWTTGDEYNLTM